MACNKCKTNHNVECGCNKKVEFCGCENKFDLLCAIYSGIPLETLGIKTNMNGNEIIAQINDYLVNVILKEPSPATELEPGVVFQTAHIDLITTQDAVNTDTMIALVNEIKHKLNEKLQKDIDSQQQAE